ncbi:MAG: beta-ketoacyl-ACP synthase II, partial [Clostridia bacterium]
MNRVVVTGMGLISPIGNNIETVRDALINGKSGISVLDVPGTTGYKTHLAAQVRDFNPEQFFDKRQVRRMDRFCQMSVAAAKMAYEMSGLADVEVDPYRAGVITGSGIGGISTFEVEHTKMLEKGMSRVSPLFVPMLIPNIAAGMITMETGFKGASYCTVTACASGAHAIGESFRAIKHGYLDVAVTGGGDAVIGPVTIAGFANMTAMTTAKDVNEGSLPFDKRRGGFVIGEGAGMLVLENYEYAKARGATILGEIAGYGATSDAYHITAPNPNGEAAAMAMKHAMDEAGVNPRDVSYINAHGTGTAANDQMETRAIKLAFGDAARSVAMSSTKSMTGHLLGAAGAVEAIFSMLAIEGGFIPPTINYKEPDEECDLDCTPGKVKYQAVDVAISNSLG